MTEPEVQPLAIATATNNLKRVFHLRDRLIQVMTPMLGTTPQTELAFDLMTESIWNVLPKRINKGHITESLWHLAGNPITALELTTTCWRIAGNLNSLAAGPVTPWAKQSRLEWVPVQINAVKAKRTQYNVGYELRFRVLAGSPCPVIITKFWSSRFCAYIAKNIGFSRRPPPDRADSVARAQYVDARELVTMRLEVLVDPKLCTGRVPGFEKLRCVKGLLNYNRRQIKFRDRLAEGFECRFGFPDTLPCRQCVKGFESCPAGCHRKDYVQRPCPICNVDDAWFDPESASRCCVGCTYKTAMARQD